MSLRTRITTKVKLHLADFVIDEDDPQHQYCDPKFKLVMLSTEDNDSISMPQLYFIPDNIPVPDCLRDGRFIRCTYDHPTDETGSKLGDWLTKMAFYQQTIDHFVCAVNRPVKKQTSMMLPKFQIPEEAD